MRLPYVIDNQGHKLADVLNSVMQDGAGHSLDIASAYFSISGFRLLKESLQNLRSFRLLLGFQPIEAKDVGMKPNASALMKALRGEVSERQWRDILGVLKTRAGELDLAYLKKWAIELNVANLLDRALKESA